MRSAEPCTVTRSESGTDSSSIVDPPMSPKFHPIPSSHRAGNTSTGPSPLRDDATVAATRIAAPRRTEARVPFPAVYRPTSGLNAYIPAMCSDTTYWLSVSCPCSFMWTGVIVMIATIAACDTTIEPSARRPLLVAVTMRSAAGMEGSFSPAEPRTPPETTSGSGRRRSETFVNATRSTHEAKSHGPVYLCHPNAFSPAHCAGPMRSGPNTAPNVEAKTMRLMARERSAGSARSVAA